MLATYLTGDRVAMRAVQLADKDHAVAWFDSEFPVNSERAETYLNEEFDGMTHNKALLIIMRVEDEEIVGGVRIDLHPRHSTVTVHMAPALEDSDELRGEAVLLLIPWLRDEGEYITVSLDVAADQTWTIAAAEDAGMVQTARFREWYCHAGHRVDRLVFQAIHPRWQREEALDA
jgi:RimJ/RimL family protein N-acetyltransferase